MQLAFVEPTRRANRLPRWRGYQLHCEEDAELFVWHIEWTSVERHLNGFRKSPEFGAFFQLVKPFYTSIQEINHYAVVAGSV